MSLRETLVKPVRINFARKCSINITKDAFKTAFITENNFKEFMNAYADFIEKVGNSNEVWDTRDYDMCCYSCRDGSAVVYHFINRKE